MARSLPFAVLVLMLGSCRPAAGPPPVELRYAPAATDAEPGRFEVHGLPPAALADESRLPAALVVQSQTGPGLLGTHGTENGVLFFRPRFPLAHDLPVTATFHPAALGLDGMERGLTYTRVRPLSPPAEVAAVYPSGDTVPENVLRFYLHFSKPMRRGEAADRVRVLDPKGDPVDMPFLDEELWDHTGTRLTLLIDPGRIKRGVKPREDIGTVFVSGGRYTLDVDAGWPDADGRPLRTGFRKTYTAIAPTSERIDPASWTVTPPTAGAPLTVRFLRPLDRALLDRMLTVTDATGTAIEGRIDVADAETTWRFTPVRPWAAGRYDLRVGVDLEDPAGNRPDRLFDTPDQNRPVERPPVLARPFEVSVSRYGIISRCIGVVSVLSEQALRTRSVRCSWRTRSGGTECRPPATRPPVGGPPGGRPSAAPAPA